VANICHNFTVGEFGFYLDVVTGDLVEGVIKSIREDSEIVYLMITLDGGSLITITARIKENANGF